MYDVMREALLNVFKVFTHFTALKWIALAVLVGITSVMGVVIDELLPEWMNPQAALDSIPADVYWFMWLVNADYGVPLVLGAMVIRFTIRRLPVVG